MSDGFVISMSKKGKKHRSGNKKNLKTNTGRNKDRMQQLRGEGKERKVHEEIMDRRIRGGISLTNEEIAEAYKRAQEQWLRLPGSINRPSTDVYLVQKQFKSQVSNGASKQTHDHTDNGAGDFES